MLRVVNTVSIWEMRRRETEDEPNHILCSWQNSKSNLVSEVEKKSAGQSSQKYHVCISAFPEIKYLSKKHRCEKSSRNFNKARFSQRVSYLQCNFLRLASFILCVLPSPWRWAWRVPGRTWSPSTIVAAFCESSNLTVPRTWLEARKSLHILNYITGDKLENEYNNYKLDQRLPKFFGDVVMQIFSKHFTVWFSLESGSVRSFHFKVEMLFSVLIVVTVLGVTFTVADANFPVDDISSSGDDEVIIVFSVNSSVIFDESTIALQCNLLFVVLCIWLLIYYL